MADGFKNVPPEAMGVPADTCVAITPSSDEIDATRAIFCNAAGGYTVVFVGQSAPVSLTLIAGLVYPFRIKQVTVGTGLFALY